MTEIQAGQQAGGTGAPLYLYAFADAVAAIPTDLCGLGGRAVLAHVAGAVAAVCSEIAPGRLRPERKHLAAHQGVLARLMADTTVLPVGFGMIVPSPAELDGMLRAEADTLGEQLDKVRGKVEMSLRVSWEAANIFQFFIEREPALRAARDLMIANPGNHQAKVAAGELFSKLIAQRRQEHEQRVVSLLEPAAEEISAEPAKSDLEVMRLAALVNRGSLSAFEARIAAAAEGFDGSYRFDYGGPWAPHSFVRLQLSFDEAAEVS